jgi:hypothetical protein
MADCNLTTEIASFGRLFVKTWAQNSWHGFGWIKKPAIAAQHKYSHGTT